VNERRGTEETRARREFLLRVATAGASGLLAACGWRGGPIADDLANFSSFNDWVSERLFGDARLAKLYPESRRTAPDRFPAYWVTQGGMPLLMDPSGWRLKVGGLVRRPLELTLEQVKALPRLTYTVKHHCVEGWTAIATWSGARFAALADAVEPAPEARYVLFRSFDSGYSNGWDMASALHPQTMLAYGFNDRELMPAHGAPLRLYSPTKLGYKLTKYLYAIEFTSYKPGGYWEDRGYPWFGGV
jgi:DMSO/TMAO reductase YedYZ molybdopterin-dependent catalytic subunit